jgi:hypothetical protein
MRSIKLFHKLAALSYLTWVAVLSLALVAGLAVAIASSSSDKNIERDDPISKLPLDEQEAAYRAVVDQVHEAQPAFLDSFKASGRDIHDLPIANLSPQVEISKSLREAVDRSALVVVGVVESQTFDETGVSSHVRVQQVISGKSSQDDVLLIHQAGGPFLNGDTPVLLQFVSDPLLWSGKSYVLFLSDQCAVKNAYCMPAAPAQIEVSPDSLLQPVLEEMWTDEFDQDSVSQLANAIEALN